MTSPEPHYLPPQPAAEPDATALEGVALEWASEPESTAPEAEPAEARTPPPVLRRPRRVKKKRRGLGMLRETAIIVIAALVLSWLIKTFLMQAFYIPSPSMEPTLSVGDRVLVSRMVPRWLSINRGDVVVFVDPGGWLNSAHVTDRGPVLNVLNSGLTAIGLLPQNSGEHLIKRVIGLPGDTVACCSPEGLVTVNGVAIDETPYLFPGAAASLTEFEAVVPAGHLWVMGDNRAQSADSRYHAADIGGRFVPIDNVVGTAFVTIWPLGNLTWHRNPGQVFRDVPDPLLH
ncbi:MAG: signal peptidase I [Promicromonosporaceae bacterium]|nr:signal peptidase I [Promicromonosporaceae bacterium]